MDERHAELLNVLASGLFIKMATYYVTLYFTGLYVQKWLEDKSAPKQSPQHDSRLKCYCIRIHCLNI